MMLFSSFYLSISLIAVIFLQVMICCECNRLNEYREDVITGLVVSYC
jgi:hypothetical protein